MVSGAAVGDMYFSTMPIVSPTLAHLGSMSVAVASEALSHGAVLIQELTVYELPIMEHAHMLQNVSFHGCSYL
jgi:hypothetical protein